MKEPIYILTEQRPRAHTTDCLIHYSSRDKVLLEELYLALVQEVEYDVFNQYVNNSYSFSSAASMARFTASEYGKRFNIIKTYMLEDILNER